MISFKDIKTFIDRKRGRMVDEEDFAGDGDDRNPGKQVLNGGEHGEIFGINRKVVSAIMVAIVLVIGMATLYNISDRQQARESKQELQGKTEEQAANLDMHGKDRTGAGGYDQLFEQQKQQTMRDAQANNSRNGNSHMAASPGNQQQARQNSQARQQAAVPALPAAPAYSAPLVLPSQQATAPAKSEAEREEEKQAKALDERYASAIEFAVGRGGSQQAEGGSNQLAQPAPGAVSSSGADSMFAQVSYSAPSDTVIQAGTVIPAMLLTGLNSDVPGQVTAQVQSDIYDSATGSRLLLPAGSTLIGSYGGESSHSAADTGRVDLKFSAIVLPDGGSFAVGDSLVAVDGAGFNGLAGKVNHHTGSRLGGGMLATALAALGSYASGNVSTQETYSGGQLAMQGALASLMNTASSLFKKGVQKQNTVTVQPGYEFNVYVTRPISLGALY